MIAFLKGRVAEIEENTAVIEVNGIGYEICVPASAVQALAAYGDEETVKVFTYTYVREDTLALFGFLSKDDLEMFKLLITVSGIGPKGAVAMLSGASTDDLRFAIMAGDVKTLSKAPGIGKKTAERVILDLRDKVSKMYDARDMEISSASAGAVNISSGNAAAAEAIEALSALGYSKAEASSAVKQCGELPDTEAYLKAALKYLG